jgi:hypothetical protein
MCIPVINWVSFTQEHLGNVVSDKQSSWKIHLIAKHRITRIGVDQKLR